MHFKVQFKGNIPGINLSSSSTVIVRSNRLFKGNIPGINLISSSTVIVRSNRLFKGNIPAINLRECFL
jgi:parallel beta-helix repeat protein